MVDYDQGENTNKPESSNKSTAPVDVQRKPTFSETSQQSQPAFPGIPQQKEPAFFWITSAGGTSFF